MTTLYRPVLIESAEQAEALPEGAIVIDDCGDRYTRPVGSGRFWGQADDGTELSTALAIGNEVTALVPIEAEEERRPGWVHVGQLIAHETPHGTAHGAEFNDRTGQPVSWERRLVTPWEEA